MSITIERRRLSDLTEMTARQQVEMAARYGGICRHPEGGGEIRRMYVAPEARGAGVGRTVLEALERWAVELGFDTLGLETGDRLLDAIRLYERAGYRRGPCWGPYLTDPKSVCYQKPMAAS